MTKRPDAETLARLFDQMPAPRIAELYGVTAYCVYAWRRQLGLPPRRAGGRSQAPPAHVLQRYIDERLTLQQIADLHGLKHKDSIYNWYKRAGIEWPHAWHFRDYPDATTLRAAYERGGTLETLAADYGVSAQVITDLCNAYGIPRRPAGKRNAVFPGNDGHPCRSSYEQRVCDWLTRHGVAHEYEPKIPDAGPARSRADFLACGIYIEVWGVTGSAEYERRKREKQARYRAAGASLVEIPAHAFATAHRGLWDRRLHSALAPACQADCVPGAGSRAKVM